MSLAATSSRASALGTLGPSLRMPPVPDGSSSVDRADRQQLAGTYAGLLAGELVRVQVAIHAASGGRIAFFPYLRP